jgi:hypothetical protein
MSLVAISALEMTQHSASPNAEALCRRLLMHVQSILLNPSLSTLSTSAACFKYCTDESSIDGS